MKKTIWLPLLLICAACTQEMKLDYPETRKENVVDNYHGTEVADPYRWLEDDRSEETARWVEAQNELTYSYLDRIPFRKELTDRMTEMWNYPKMGTPRKEGLLYFYTYNTGLQNQDIIYKTTDLESEGEPFLDPNKLSEDGTVALSHFSVSHDQKYMAYAISRGGSDWHEILVRDVESGKDLADHIMWVKFSEISWYKDGFFYTRYEQPEEGDELMAANMNAKIYYHRVGTVQDEDLLIHKDPDRPERGFNLEVNEEESYMFLTATESTSGNAIGFCTAGTVMDGITWIDEDFNNDYLTIGTVEDKLYVLTNHDAPNFRLLAIDLKDPSEDKWQEVIPESENQVLEAAYLAGGKIIATFLKDAYNQASVYDLEGTFIHSVELPGIGSIETFTSRMKDNTAYFSFSSFNYPSTIFEYRISENQTEVYYAPEVDFDSDAYETRQVFYSSKDGTKIPMFIVHKRGVELNGDNPTLLYGYGGFNISLSPSFSTTRAVWLEQGGVFALANIRGGGEYGKEWHKAGTLLQKQNVFDDFIAAAEYLIDENYTSPSKLACYGGSNGGLLIGAVVNQRPDLFVAAVPFVGVMDMLRFHLFTIGRYWTVDYGCSDNKEQFEYLLTYSPLHNISSDLEYPAIMVCTGDHDDRVVPAHSFKYAATLQEKYTGDHPVLIRINTDAGHGAGKPTEKVIAEYADVWSFILYQMDVQATQP